MIRKSLLAIATLALLATPAVRANISLTIDPNYPSSPAFFSIDPESHGVAQRGVAGTRQLRQTFQLSQSIAVDSITLSLVMSGTDGGLNLSFYQVDDVNSTTWTPGTLIKTLTLSTNVDLPSTTLRLGLDLTGSDIFNLPQRDSGALGYGIEISNDDGVSNIGNLRHSNDGTDDYTGGKFYTETGGESGTGGVRDIGLALTGTAIVPEPGTFLLAGLGAIGLLLFRRRRAG